MSSSEQVVLVVDDVASFRAIIRDMLLDIGFTNVIEAADGGEALERAREHKLVLIISDYMMSPRTGLDLLAGLQGDAELKRIPVIMVSAVGEDDVLKRARALGATEWLQRPVSFEALRRSVVKALTSRPQAE